MLSKIKHYIRVKKQNRAVSRAFEKEQKLGTVEGYDGERNQTFIDTLLVNDGVAWVNRDWLSVDGDHRDSEDVTEDYLE